MAMQKLQHASPDGRRVEVRGEGWLVVRSERFEDCALVTLRGAGPQNRGQVLQLLTPFDRLKPATPISRLTRRTRSNVLRIAAHTVSQAHEWLEPWTTLTAKIDLLPWQCEPAMAAVAGATRILLLDGVGLGKTIQAGLMLSELWARGLASRVLILTPASLRHQWASELRSRFELEPLVLDHEQLARRTSSLPPGVNPWTTSAIVISSIDLVKRAEVRLAIESAPLDVVVVDEAHHLTPGSDRSAVVAEIAGRATWVALATATPHSGDTGAFSFLSRIGAHTDSAPMTFRRHARVVAARTERHVHLHCVRSTSAERDLLDETMKYARSLWQLRDRSRVGAPILATVICRRAASSAHALSRTLARRRALLAGLGEEPFEQPALPWLEDEQADGVGADTVLASSPLPDRAAEMAWLDRLVALAERVDVGAKLETLERILSRTGEPAIVFSEYRDTLIDSERHLAPGFAIARLHGGLSTAERRDEIERFVTGDARLLLASDAAGEGLNLQARCRLVVNLELPWSPVRIEQRIGRVDRLGQTRRVHAIHLYHRGSYEEHVLARLQRRLAAAARDLRTVAYDESAVAETVFDGTSFPEAVSSESPVGADWRASTVKVAEMRRRSLALANVAGLVPDRAGPSCAMLSGAKRLACGVSLLFAWDVHDAERRVVSRQATCVHVTFIRAIPVGRLEIRRCTRDLAASDMVRDTLRRLRSASLDRARSNTAGTADALGVRLLEIDAHLQDSRPRMIQGSLFERRAEQQAWAARESIDALRRHVAERRASADRLRSVSAEEPRLVAAWAVSCE
jgi:superfamily II DNA or RNA helicase